ncbi:MAG: hypothetical protein IKB33_02265 [Spirochaetaceae bacterium]|nr:hypothetical protein [Spirochaetaceae bacterium]
MTELAKAAEAGMGAAEKGTTFDPDKKVGKGEFSSPVEAQQGRVYDPDRKVEKGEAIQNKQDGLRREEEVASELKEKYPEEDGYEIISEAYLRDKDGNIVKDPDTGEARRVDFVVVKDGKAVDSVEVTSKTADKTGQTAKEERIRENGGNYVKDSNGKLVEIPKEVKTRIERRD